jgi:adenylate cyclase
LLSADGSLATSLARFAALGVAPDDSDQLRTRKVALTTAASLITALAVVWVGTYLALGAPVSAAIPFTYQVLSIVSIALFARFKSYPLFRTSQLALMTLLPFVLQWSLGGYEASSAVSLWALVAAFGALVFADPRGAIPWYLAFLTLTIVSAILDPILPRTTFIGEPVRIAFFVLNISGVSLTAYLLLQYFVRSRDAAFLRSEGLLLNVLPKVIAERLKRGEGSIAEGYDEVSVLFADVVDFTSFAERTSPQCVVAVLDEIFSAFDGLALHYGLEKIKTIGDAYLVVGGLPEPRPDHAEAIADLGLDMQAAVGRLCESLGLELAIRIGINSGPVIAGVIGRHKFIYDLWGDTVNTASRMESQGIAGGIQVTEATYLRLRDTFRFEARGPIDVKGKGRLPTYLLLGREDTHHPPAPDAVQA